MTRWGITFPLRDLPLRAHEQLFAELPQLGYTDAWTAEVGEFDAFTPLAVAATWPTTLRLGTAIVPIYTRGPALLAMSAAALAELAPERFVLGIGTSSATIVEDWNAAELRDAYGRSRDTLRFLAQAFSGDRVDADMPTFSVRGFRLGRPPAVPPRVVLAGLRGGMLRLAQREADGAVTNWLAADDVPQVREAFGEGKELIGRVFVCLTEDKDVARATGRRLIANYLTVPAYAAFHDWLGRGDDLAEMHRAWATGDRKAAADAVPDTVVDALIVHGSAEQCRERMLEYAANGLDTVVSVVVGSDRSSEESVRALAPV